MAVPLSIECFLLANLFFFPGRARLLQRLLLTLQVLLTLVDRLRFPVDCFFFLFDPSFDAVDFLSPLS